MEAKEGRSEYAALFLPWFIQPEYADNRATWHSLGELTGRERATIEAGERYATADGRLVGFAGVTPGQIAWRRFQVRTEFHGDEDRFANQYPATEEEAFLAGGLNIFTPQQVSMARRTERPPVWVGDLLPSADPKDYTLNANPSGDLLVWEWPDVRHHYVVGADVQWGSKETADYDVAYVQCLESNRTVARLRGRYDMGRWATLLAALGTHYNGAVLAPERNSQAASGVVAVLRGLSGLGWSYPNVWIRSDDLKLRGHRPEDFGWLTNEHTKAELIAFAKEQTLAEGFDWADRMCVDEMAAYIRDDRGKLTAPEGAHDDCLMARMITAMVAHRVRATVDLYVDPTPAVYTFDGIQARMARVLGLERDDEGLSGESTG